MKTISVEGVWSLGGEARFVLAPQDPMGEGELDLWVLQGKKTLQYSDLRWLFYVTAHFILDGTDVWILKKVKV